MPAKAVLTLLAALLTRRSPLLAALLLSACSLPPNNHQHVADQTVPTSLYCDSYFVYGMCAQDVDNDTQVDYMYFTDTNEIFMINPAYTSLEQTALTFHQCIQLMDERMLEASSRLLLITDESSALEKARIKGQLILNYSRYMNDIQACKNAKALTQTDTGHSDGSNFGDEDFEDF